LIKAAQLTIGVLATLMGLLWVGQGLGIILWPAQSFMLAQGQWAVYGAALAAMGVALIIWSRRR
jgi:uncharacterized membrane protein